MSLKIGIVFSDLPQEDKKPGGVSVVVHELANALVRDGNFVRIYSYSPKPTESLYEVFQIFPLINLRFSRRIVLPFQLPSLNFEDLDLLHLHGEDWAFLNRSIPTVRTFHGCSLNEAKFAKSLKAKLVFAAYHPLELWAKKLADVPVGIGNDTAQILGVEQIIPNGYAKDIYFYDQKSSQPRAIVVGTLEGRKQTKLAIELLLSLKNQIPDLKIHAVVDKPYNHPSVQNWIGISREQLAKLVRESWIGVSTTLYEGFGIYYLEWMAAGTVPITFSNIGVRSLIHNSQAGFLGDNISELRDAALLMLKDASARDKYSQNCLTVTQSLSWDDIAQQYMKVYSEVLTGRN
jgi:phosphatidyl-myo-inositol alpha-mannosyltransferase